MFCDLIGSTEMSQKLDPEELREINTAYQVASTGAIELFGGYVARYMGDGVLAYFGYPQAHEDDAERAVLAGLAIVEAITAIKPGRVRPRKKLLLAKHRIWLHACRVLPILTR
jgi:class 3 adenylate cyclase